MWKSQILVWEFKKMNLGDANTTKHLEVRLCPSVVAAEGDHSTCKSWIQSVSEWCLLFPRPLAHNAHKTPDKYMDTNLSQTRKKLNSIIQSIGLIEWLLQQHACLHTGSVCSGNRHTPRIADRLPTMQAWCWHHSNRHFVPRPGCLALHCLTLICIDLLCLLCFVLLRVALLWLPFLCFAVLGLSLLCFITLYLQCWALRGIALRCIVLLRKAVKAVFALRWTALLWACLHCIALLCFEHCHESGYFAWIALHCTALLSIAVICCALIWFARLCFALLCLPSICLVC